MSHKNQATRIEPQKQTHVFYWNEHMRWQRGQSGTGKHGVIAVKSAKQARVNERLLPGHSGFWNIQSLLVYDISLSCSDGKTNMLRRENTMWSRSSYFLMSLPWWQTSCCVLHTHVELKKWKRGFQFLWFRPKLCWRAAATALCCTWITLDRKWWAGLLK